MHSRFKFRVPAMLALLFLVVACTRDLSQKGDHPEPFSLRFKEDGSFKIAQFTDIHWDNDNSEACTNAARLIRHVLDAEKPDLAVLTGDAVVHKAEAGWKALMPLFLESGIPFAVVMGNHDDEAEWSRNQIFEYLETLEGFAGSKGPSSVSGVGNYIIGLRSTASDSLAALLYFIDSNSYCEDKGISHYGWIRFDQIAWYREQSRKFTALNDGNPLSALAFFHIPLPEYWEIPGKELTMGIMEEEVCSPGINSGMLAAFVEMKDVMGTFVGHDHDNNYIGIHKGVALAYGQKTGFGSYGNIGRGSRIIEFREGERSFNTWIRTEEGTAYQYNYPLGYSFRLEEHSLMSSKDSEPVANGLRFRYFRGNFSSVEELNGLTPDKQGSTEIITLGMATDEDHFGLEFKGVIRIPEPGIYRFHTRSDDGSRLYIGDSLVVDNDGSHSVRIAGGAIGLRDGYHPFRLLYFENRSGQTLEVRYAGLGIPEQPLPAEMLFYEAEPLQSEKR